MLLPGYQLPLQTGAMGLRINMLSLQPAALVQANDFWLRFARN